MRSKPVYVLGTKLLYKVHHYVFNEISWDVRAMLANINSLALVACETCSSRGFFGSIKQLLGWAQ